MKSIKTVLAAVLFMGLSVSTVFAQEQAQAELMAVETMTCPKGTFYTSVGDVTMYILSKGVSEIGLSYHPTRTKTQRMVLCDDKWVPTPWLSGPKFSTSDIIAVKKMYLNDGPFACSGPWVAATKPNGKAAYLEVNPSGSTPKVFIRQK